MTKSGHQTDTALAKVLREVQEVESRENSDTVIKDLPFRRGYVQQLTERFHDLGVVPTGDTSQTTGTNVTTTKEVTLKAKERMAGTFANGVTPSASQKKLDNQRTNRASATYTTTVFIIPKNGGPIVTEKIPTSAAAKLPSTNGHVKSELTDITVSSSATTKTPVVNIPGKKDTVDAVISGNVTFRSVTAHDEDNDLPVKNIVRDRLNIFENDNISKSKVSPRVPLSFHRSNHASNVTSSSHQKHQQTSTKFPSNSSSNVPPRTIAPSVTLSKANAPLVKNIAQTASRSIENGNHHLLHTAVTSTSKTTAVKIISSSFPARQTAPNQQILVNENSSSERWKSWDDIPKPVPKMPLDNVKRVEVSDAELLKIRKAGKSWVFGKNLNELEERTLGAKIVEIRGSAGTKGYAEHTRQSDSTKTQERLAQETFWDVYRSTDEDKLIAHDSDLAEEARLLMLQQNTDPFDEDDSLSVSSVGNNNGEPVEAARHGKLKSTLRQRKLNRRLRFAVESQLESTFEYQSEESLIAELGITPDYPLETFVPNLVVEEDIASTDVVPSGTLHLASVKPGLLFATYSNTGNAEYNWGAASSNLESSPNVSLSATTSSSDAVDSSETEDTVVFSSAASDLLF